MNPAGRGRKTQPLPLSVTGSFFHKQKQSKQTPFNCLPVFKFTTDTRAAALTGPRPGDPGRRGPSRLPPAPLRGPDPRGRPCASGSPVRPPPDPYPRAGSRPAASGATRGRGRARGGRGAGAAAPVMSLGPRRQSRTPRTRGRAPRRLGPPRSGRGARDFGIGAP